MDPLGGILESIFGQRGHLGVLSNVLKVLEIHELLLVCDVSVVSSQADQVLDLVNGKLTGIQMNKMRPLTFRQSFVR